MNDKITKTVSEVKQRYRMKETTATNGPEGTVSKKTQVSLNLLEQRMRRLHDSITIINKDFLDDVELSGVPNDTKTGNLTYDSTSTANVFPRQLQLIINFPGKKISALHC